MSEWKDDQQLFAIIRAELYTAVVGDVMDSLGFLNQFLSPRIQPLKEEMFVTGRAMPVLEADMNHEFSAHNARLNRPFGLMLEALDDLQCGEVYVCTGASPNYALWGELMSSRAIKLGAAGAVVNGYSRDTRGVLKLNFPTFSYGRYAQDQAPRGKVIDFRIPIKMDNVTINPGDIIIGDIDGVCVVPKQVEDEVIMKALEKARGEKMVQAKILEGMPAKEAFETYGIM